MDSNISNTLGDSVTIVGVPTNLGANNMGVEMGPNAYRHHGMIPKLQQAGFQVQDVGNIRCEERWKVDAGTNSKLHYLQEVARISQDAAQAVHQAIDNNTRPVVIGGDHTTCLGAVSGASVAVDGDIGLIYIDAHGDMNTDQTTLTGNIHGMQLAALMGFGHDQLVRVHGDQIKVAKQHVLHVGGCDWDQAELDLVQRENIATFTVDNLLQHGMAPLFPLIAKLQSQVKYIWISLDLDSIDAQYAPAAGMPNNKGLLYREIAAIAKYIGAHCNVIGLDVVEYNPLADIDYKTASLATELIATMLGKEYNWYSEYLSRNPDSATGDH